ncbi:MAG: hypothetical protein M1831_002882 [Alyxoria varia]|nr:MAG: hypothetical protein M1831_002882 [Alyxoria varia]
MPSSEDTSINEFDVIVVGAGISGVNAGYRLQTEVPGCNYTILEARDGIGGTWDFFRYPGIRSDSDLHTFGFPWRPWPNDQIIADGESIKKYILDTASVFGIDQRVQYRHKLIAADWKTERQTWTLTVENDERRMYFTTRFVIFSTGYYDYEEALPATINGLQKYTGTVVHPQFWPQDLDYAGKEVVIVGSGATAITLLPSLAQKAKHVTMIQRSPSYIVSIPAVDGPGEFFKRWLPRWLAYKMIRLKFLVLPLLFFWYCQIFPSSARRLIKRGTLKDLPQNVPHDPHFVPSYNPWDQRLCIAPDGDFYAALREGKTSIATGHIKTITSNRILLESGQEVSADILVTATGLQIRFAGGTTLSVDGKALKLPHKFLWKGIMLQDVPNAAFVIGYTNASWTLRSDATALHICRIVNSLNARGFSSAVPRLDNDNNGMEQQEEEEEEKGRGKVTGKHRESPLNGAANGSISQPVKPTHHPAKSNAAISPCSPINLNSTYVKRALGYLPKAGDKGPWRVRSNYFQDLWEAKYGKLEGMEGPHGAYGGLVFEKSNY